MSSCRRDVENRLDAIEQRLSAIEGKLDGRVRRGVVRIDPVQPSVDDEITMDCVVSAAVNMDYEYKALREQVRQQLNEEAPFPF